MKISDNITLCADGKYRWTYEVSLFKNPMYFFLIWKIFFFIILGIFLIAFVADAINWGFDDAVGSLKIMVYFILGMTVLVGLGYLLYAAIMGGKYIVDFEMDEAGINHAQTAAQAKKAKKIATITTLAGAATGRLSTVGAGMAAQRTEMYSEFAKVRKVKAYPSRNLIKVNGLLDHNQVYAAPEDFDFVYQYIASRCVNVK